MPPEPPIKTLPKPVRSKPRARRPAEAAPASPKASRSSPRKPKAKKNVYGIRTHFVYGFRTRVVPKTSPKPTPLKFQKTYKKSMLLAVFSSQNGKVFGSFWDHPCTESVQKMCTDSVHGFLPLSVLGFQFSKFGGRNPYTIVDGIRTHFLYGFRTIFLYGFRARVSQESLQNGPPKPSSRRIPETP